MPSCSCICSPVSRKEAIRKAECLKQHEPYAWALEGTLENILIVDCFLRQRGIKGVLFGGCVEKGLPRKDIDVYLPDPVCGIAYKQLGVDWWIYDGEKKMAININGIEVWPHEEYAAEKYDGLVLSRECGYNDELWVALYMQK